MPELHCKWAEFNGTSKIESAFCSFNMEQPDRYTNIGLIYSVGHSSDICWTIRMPNMGGRIDLPISPTLG